MSRGITKLCLPSVLVAMLAIPVTPMPSNAQAGGGALPPKTWSCAGNVWVFNGVELGFLDRGKLALALGQQVLPAGCYWYDPVSGMIGCEGAAPAGDLPAGMELGGPLRADASNGNTGIFLNGREMTAAEVVGFQRMGAVLTSGRYWMNPQGVGGREGQSAEFQLTAAQAAPPDRSPSTPRAQSKSTTDHLYQSGDTHGGVQGNCVFMSGPGFSYMGEGC